jgi:hypothetical protein
MISRGLFEFSKVVPRKYLPQRVRALLHGPGVSNRGKMEKLGTIVGLSPQEVQSVVDSRTGQIVRTSSWVVGRMLLYLSFILVLVVIMFFIFAPNLDWGTAIGNTTPTPTYTPGTRYGSVSPKDFE